jgi:hypothetical protein
MLHTTTTKLVNLINDKKNELLLELIKLTERRDKQYRYELFQMGGFYMEVRWSLLTGAKRGVRVFDNPDILEPYFNEINLSEVYE